MIRRPYLFVAMVTVLVSSLFFYAQGSKQFDAAEKTLGKIASVEPAATNATRAESVPTEVAKVSGQPSVRVTFYLRDVISERQAPFYGQLPKVLATPVRPFFFDEEKGPEIKAVIDGEKTLIVQINSFPDSVTFLSPRREVAGSDWGVADPNGNMYIFRAEQNLWAFKPDVDLRRAVKDSNYARQVGIELYNQTWGLLVENRKNLMVAENYNLQPQEVFGDLTEFKMPGGVGFVMGAKDAKRFAYYNGQPHVAFTWQDRKLYGWLYPNQDGGKECGYTHLALAYNVNVGYDTPYKVGGLTYVDVIGKEDGFLPHGTMLIDGKPMDWQMACQKTS